MSPGDKGMMAEEVEKESRDSGGGKVALWLNSHIVCPKHKHSHCCKPYFFIKKKDGAQVIVYKVGHLPCNSQPSFNLQIPYGPPRLPEVFLE